MGTTLLTKVHYQSAVKNERLTSTVSTENGDLRLFHFIQPRNYDRDR